MSDIVIPYVHSPANELKYALRSLEKFQPESRVVLVGDIPDWYKGDSIYHKKNCLTKQLNVLDKLLLATSQIPDFVLTYDDVYQLKEGEIKTTHCGTLKDASKKNLGTWFKANVTNTMLIYPDGFYYGNHQPIEINGKKFVEAMKVNWKKDYLVKSLYGNYANLQGEYVTDCKFRLGNIQEFIKDRQFLSTENMTGDVLKLLNQLFPHAGRYEKGDSN
jgi:hypothetical protein